MNRKRRTSIILLIITVILLTACTSEKSAGQFYKDGMNYFQDKKYEEAAEALSKAVKKNPQKAEYFISYGMSLIKTKQYEEALVQFKKAVMDKDNQIVRENNKKAYRGAGIAYYEWGQYEKAVKSFQKALDIKDLDELDLDILSYQAAVQEALGNNKEAVAVYTQIISMDQKNAANYAKRAQLYQYLGSTEEALTDYEKAVSLDKNNYDYYFGEYFLYRQTDDGVGAEKVLKEALALNVKDNEDKFNVAKIHFYQEDYEGAQKEFTSLAEADYLEAYYYLGLISETQEEYQAAVDSYEAYLQAESGRNLAGAYNQAGLCYMKLEEYDKALERIKAGLALNDSSWLKSLSYNEIAVLEHLSKFDVASQKASAYLEKYPEDEGMLREYEFIQTRLGKGTGGKGSK